MLGKSRRAVYLCIVLCLLALVALATGAAAARLYAGTSYPGCVWSYDKGLWQGASPVLGEAVLCLTEYDGDLYAGIRTSDQVGKVYRWDGKDKWKQVGGNLDYGVLVLAIYKGKLYAGTGGSGGRLYRCDSGKSWTCMVDGIEGWNSIMSLYAASDGWLYLGDGSMDYIARFDGKSVHDTVYLGGSCIYDFAEFDGQLFAAAWAGRLLRTTDGQSWSDVIYRGGYTWALEVFQNCLYMGYESGDLCRLDSSDIEEIVWTCGSPIISMIADGDSLYLGTGGETGYQWDTAGMGNVYKYDGRGYPEQISDVLGVGVQCFCLYQKKAKTVGTDKPKKYGI